ncbi:hypothetical protein DOTSEDRAFT_70321 [Dothistroma septosporum NZE10]|uniref:Uncharacterized protein n=1 Tax=Dothistroma septosporum (strain NZE10 / CBS 128990) TaxID=675120 RepID=N1PV49_DOTSN|nr:hypothetical protein DOTSEDRAFT_70321 [Dothistroma septosporum NZE10]
MQASFWTMSQLLDLRKRPTMARGRLSRIAAVQSYTTPDVPQLNTVTPYTTISDVRLIVHPIFVLARTICSVLAETFTVPHCEHVVQSLIVPSRTLNR